MIEMLDDRPNQEIERKFLIDRDSIPYRLNTLPHCRIKQGYVVIAENGDEVRLRQKGDRYFQAIKGKGGFSRTEIEIELSSTQFQRLWPATAGKRLEKTRYEIDENDCRIELDVYEGNLDGLITAEVEFDSIQSGVAFKSPGWFGRELTEDDEYKNQNLAMYGLPRWALRS